MPTPADYHWLLSAEAESWLRRVREETAVQPLLPAKVVALRRDLGPERTRLVCEQVELRRRAKVKFARAEELFFTPKGLEQATDETLARYKAARLGNHEVVDDFCCGIGGDAMALAERACVRLVDLDETSLLLARENVTRVGGRAEGKCADIATLAREPRSAWHVDPDRRSEGKRITQLDYLQPGVEVLESLRAGCVHGAMKLAPATELPRDWESACEAEWIETRGECRQLMAWFGDWTTTLGQRTATVIDREGKARRYSSDEVFSPPVAARIGKFVYDPAPSLLAARLLGAWSCEFKLGTIGEKCAYLTGDEWVCSPHVATFEVVDILPLDVSKLRAYFRERGVGRLEIKQRGVGITPETLRPQLKLSGDTEATLILAETMLGKRGLVCRRPTAS